MESNLENKMFLFVAAKMSWTKTKWFLDSNLAEGQILRISAEG